MDRVELKLVLSSAGHEAVFSVLDGNTHAAPLRCVYFLDTPGLARCGAIVRVRRNRRGTDDSAVKLRSAAAVRLSGDVLRSANLTVELDALPGRTIWSATTCIPEHVCHSRPKPAFPWFFTQGTRSPAASV